jgi:hypothetical protein
MCCANVVILCFLIQKTFEILAYFTTSTSVSPFKGKGKDNNLYEELKREGPDKVMEA